MIQQPTNKSFLSNNKFEFAISRLPNFTFFVQNISLPDISLSSSEIPTPLVRLKLPGNQLEYGQLAMTFIVDEDMQSWFELYDWMTNLGNPDSFDKRGSLTDQPGKNNSTTSDATLFIKTNSNNPNIVIDFKDIYPISLSELAFSSTETQEFITCSSTFAYSFYTAKKLT